jgi:hypothetical protein
MRDPTRLTAYQGGAGTLENRSLLSRLQSGTAVALSSEAQRRAKKTCQQLSITSWSAPMRALVFLALVVIVLALVGWISFSKGPDRTSINIEANKIRQDTKQLMGSGGEMLHKAGDKVETAADRAPPEVPNNRPVPETR